MIPPHLHFPPIPLASTHRWLLESWWPLDPISATFLVLGLALILLWTIHRIRQKRTETIDDRRPLPGAPQQRLTIDERLERDRQLRGVETDLRTLMSQIEQTAQKATRQIEQQSHRLEQLIEQADQRIALLQSPPLTPPLTPPLISPLTHPQNSPPNLLNRTQPKPSIPKIPTDALTQSVYTLADQGLSPQEIAVKLSEHTGKVELILALRQV